MIQPEKSGYLGITEELQFGMSKLWKTIGKSREQRQSMPFYRGKEEVGKNCFEQKFVGSKWEFKVVVVSHWL